MTKKIGPIPIWGYAIGIAAITLAAVAYVAISRVAGELMPVISAIRAEHGITPGVAVRNSRTLIITVNAAQDREPADVEAKQIARTALSHYPRATELQTVRVDVVHSVRRGSMTVTTTLGSYRWNTGLLR